MEAILFAGIPMTPNSGHFQPPLLSLELPLLQWQWQKITQYSYLDLESFQMKQTKNFNIFTFMLGNV